MNAMPPIMHQTWKNTPIPAAWQRYQASWWQQHPQWTYRLWTDEDKRHFIHTHYAWFLLTYGAYALHHWRGAGAPGPPPHAPRRQAPPSIVYTRAVLSRLPTWTRREQRPHRTRLRKSHRASPA